MINHPLSELFNKDSVLKDIRITGPDFSLDYNHIYEESMELDESINSGPTLEFGSCQASCFKITIDNVITSPMYKWITVDMVLNEDTAHPVPLGMYKVVEVALTADKKRMQLTCYDAMYDIVNADVTNWYKHLSFPMTLKNFRNSFFNLFSITQESTNLVNDNVSIKKGINPEVLSGADVIFAICQLNGVFGHINRNGQMRYIRLDTAIDGLYPANDLYPSNNLYPIQTNVSRDIVTGHYTECTHEYYETRFIDTVQVRTTENDIGAVTGQGGNSFIVSGNFLVGKMAVSEMQAVANNLLSVVSMAQYTPCKCEAIGNPCIEVGDIIRINTSDEIFTSYVLNRTLKGIQTLKDSYLSEGEEIRSEDVNGYNNSLIDIKGKTNELIRTADELSSRITDTEAGLSSQILQTSKEISLKVNSNTKVYDESYWMYAPSGSTQKTEAKIKNRGNGNPNDVLPANPNLKPAGGSGTDATYYYYLDLDTGYVWRKRPSDSSFTRLTSHSPLSKVNDTFSSALSVLDSQIRADVVEKVGGNEQSFGWSLTSTAFTLKSNGSTVFKCNSSGVEITGKVTATSGRIGDCDITGGKLVINEINADIINAGTLNAARIAAGSITNSKIDSVGYNKVKDGSYQVITKDGQGRYKIESLVSDTLIATSLYPTNCYCDSFYTEINGSRKHLAPHAVQGINGHTLYVLAWDASQ